MSDPRPIGGPAAQACTPATAVTTCEFGSRTTLTTTHSSSRVKLLPSFNHGGAIRMGLMRRISATLVLIAASVLPARNASAGGGPENVLLVVNSASWASQTVANH